MKYLHNFSLKGKRVLLRADLNSDVKNGRVIEGPRTKAAASTVAILKRKGARVVILAHQGNKGKKDFTSLKSHARHLSKYTRVSFQDGLHDVKTIKRIESLKNGEVLLLENVRFESHETKNPKKGNRLIARLGPLFDLYINDAFSVCHRDHTSIIGFPKVLPACAGPLIKKELEALKKLKVKNALFVLGGGKPESTAKLIGKNKVLAAGYFGQMILIANGQNLGYQNKYLKRDALVKGDWNKFLKKLKRKAKQVNTPIDFALNIKGKRIERLLEEFPQSHQIDDIGQETIKHFKREIAKAKAIYMKGPLGYATSQKFAKGTIQILRAIAKAKAFSVVGGGHLSTAISQYKIKKSGFNHISLSGGALASWIAGEKLPGLTALERS